MAGNTPATETFAGSDAPIAGGNSAPKQPTPDAEETVSPIFGLCKDVTIVVCGTGEALPLLEKAWKQKAAPATVITRDAEAEPFAERITRLMAEDNVPDSFIYVPANCFPTHSVGLADLTAYRIRCVLTKKNPETWKKTFQTGLPVLLEATAVLKTMELLNNDTDFSEAEFFEKYNGIAHTGELAEEVGMGFGNTVAYSTGIPRCMAAVADAMVRKKFICTTAEGFAPIKERLALLYDGK